MRDELLILVIGVTIATLVLLIIMLLFASVIRRGVNERKYRKLDALRALYEKKIQTALSAGEMDSAVRDCAAPPGSVAWQAIEDVLLRLNVIERYSEGAKQLIGRLGYISHYEQQLASRNVHIRSLSIDKLGKMKSSASVPRLIGLLDAKNPEIVSITVWSLSKIGGKESLQAIGKRLPALLGRSDISSKALRTALLTFGADLIPYLVVADEKHNNPYVASSMLEILSRMPAEARSANLAIRCLHYADAEVRSKALKVLDRPENINLAPNLSGLIIPLLQDPVWFVRLQAVRSVSTIKSKAAAGLIEKLIYDRDWHVRNAAAQAVIMFGESSLDIILEVLAGTDNYAKESVCEEIENMGLTAQLIENLTKNDAVLRKKSRRILKMMSSIGFSSPPGNYEAQRT